MRKFEYSISNVNLGQYNADELNRLGGEGWEFVHAIEPVITPRGQVTRCLFKREVSETSGDNNS